MNPAFLGLTQSVVYTSKHLKIKRNINLCARISQVGREVAGAA